MRLKKLILQGFKSFADRTEFVFDSPITGIVGPNGCGKSNVVDGFKWVLGEQSAKSLRGEAMLDVIFNGSAGRKPSGMAEVTLVFENPRRDDGTRLLALDTDEVSVGRRLFRDGTSEYQINNHTGRLKDIRELFLDTGVGVDAYSVIEQGRVAALLEANPAERRLIFEEAAGISKYKQKKKEAQRKLEKVDQNLLRVTDIVEEVERRLRSVKLQAGKARNYQEYSTRLSELRLTYSLQEYHTWHSQLGELEAARGDAQFRLDDISTDLQRKTTELTEKREQFETLSRKRQETEYKLVQARAAMQQTVQRQHYAEQQLKQIAEQVASFEQDEKAARAKLDEVSASLESESASLQSLTAQVADHRKQIEERQAAFRDAQLKLNQLNQDIERNKAAILDLMRKLSNVGSRIGAIEIERKNITAQQTRLGERRQVVLAELEALEAAKKEIEAKLAEVVGQIAEQQSALEAKRSEAAALGKEIAETNQSLGRAREHRSGLLSRKKVLEDLEAKREGVSEGVKSVLRQREGKYPFIRGLVADVLRVDVEHAHVIEAALDGRDQWLIATDAAAVLQHQGSLAKLEGRVNMICSTGILPVVADHGQDARATTEAHDWNQHPHGVRLAIDLVQFEEADAAIAQRLLGRTVVVDNLNVAFDLHANAPTGWRFVTKAGQVLEADGTLRAGPLTAAMGIISRRSELNAITQQITDADAKIAELQQKLTANNEQAKALDTAQNELRTAVYQFNTRRVELSGQVTQNNDKQSSLRREQPILDRELQQLLDSTGRLKAEEQKLLDQRTQWETEQTERQQSVEQMTADHARIGEELKSWGEELTMRRVALGQVQEKQYAAQQAVQRLGGAKNELSQQIERIVKSAESVSSRREGIERELTEAKHAETKLVAEQKEYGELLESLTARVTEAGELVKSLSAEVDTLRGGHGEVEHELHELDMKLSELRVRLETLVTRTRDELQLDLPARYTELAGEEGYKPEDQDWDAVAAEIKELKDKIHRLGNVNIDAISEQDELEQRSQFLATQINDLTESKRQLETLIEEINGESSKRFEETFNAVREHFQGMFRKLFGGGKADIILETEIEDKKLQDPHVGPDGQTVLPIMKRVDVLDAGIEIIARPPGKQPCSISQLSGGEKAMTCIALLMSIFKSKPSPFCILDEVDAPLDEANNQRFGLIVQEFLEMSQFIIITHHKRTMQIADILYGVTMQEQGVSKRVAVKFDDIGSNGQISQRAVDAEQQREREQSEAREEEHVAA